jgi:hypothetical protein
MVFRKVVSTSCSATLSSVRGSEPTPGRSPFASGGASSVVGFATSDLYPETTASTLRGQPGYGAVWSKNS